MSNFMDIKLNGTNYHISSMHVHNKGEEPKLKYHVFDDNYNFVTTMTCKDDKEFNIMFENYLTNGNKCMRWCEIYIKMKEEGAFARRAVWGSKYLIWLKPVFMIQEDWCKDENLKTLINKFGIKNDNGVKVLKGEEAFSLFNGRTIEAGWQPRPEDKLADDWEIVKLK